VICHIIKKLINSNNLHGNYLKLCARLIIRDIILGMPQHWRVTKVLLQAHQGQGGARQGYDAQEVAFVVNK
jgi:hypothetical protein